MQVISWGMRMKLSHAFIMSWIMNSMNPIWLLAMLHVDRSNMGITIGSPSRFSSSVWVKYSSAILGKQTTILLQIQINANHRIGTFHSIVHFLLPFCPFGAETEWSRRIADISTFD